jgi:hypothetical protein
MVATSEVEYEADGGVMIGHLAVPDAASERQPPKPSVVFGLQVTR